MGALALRLKYKFYSCLLYVQLVYSYILTFAISRVCVWVCEERCTCMRLFYGLFATLSLLRYLCIVASKQIK